MNGSERTRKDAAENSRGEPLRISLSRLAQRIFIAAGLLLMGYAGGTVAYAGLYQRYHSWKFAQESAAPHARSASITVTTPLLREGDRIGKLEVHRLGISVMIFHGIEESTLIAGAGHVPATPLPGGEGNVVIAAHRDTFFRKLEGILAGDTVQVATLLQSHKYIVEATEIVDPSETRVMESHGLPQLTLITCYPFDFVGAAPMRFIVHASLLK